MSEESNTVDSGPRPWPGSPFPLGASWDGEGVNFALWAPEAESVDVCLFSNDGNGGTRERRVALEESTYHVWHGYLPGIAPRQRYGYRVNGPWDPHRGARWNPSKLLVDPYARALCGDYVLADAVCPPTGADDSVQDHRDSGPFVPKSVVVHDDFPWTTAPGGQELRPLTEWADTVIYECHVKGMTMRHPQVPEHLRGTYAGLAHPSVLDHLVSLGVTAVELMPVHHFVSEPHLLRAGLVNYWGYNTLGFFAPHGAYSASGTRGEQVREFKAMVRALHAAGMEVILDVVYNHTAEGDETGPTLSFRGIDNPTYYRLRDGDPRHYLDYTGTGNTLNAQQPHVLQLITDSLRYWVTEMHVDGFRFDLASALARSLHDVDKLSGFFEVIQQDPVLSRVKLIAEPWDVGPGGYMVGEFPPLWTEWNGKFRDTVRDFWRGRESGVSDFASRLSGSSDLYQDDGRRPFASINFVTCHDGFSLRDLVSYDDKHNEANGENNRDGNDDNRSWNCGVEGETTEADVLALRDRQIRNLFTTVLTAAGVPMIRSGDELAQTLGGNNNAYCHDDESTWLDWSASPYSALIARLLRLRHEHPVLRQRAFFSGRPIGQAGLKDLAWFAPNGSEMGDADWGDQSRRTLAMYLSGQGIRTRGRQGERITDDSFLIVLHAGQTSCDVTLPGPPWAEGYEVEVTSCDGLAPAPAAGEVLAMKSFSSALLRVVS
jgi:glycogen operon protein